MSGIRCSNCKSPVHGSVIQCHHCGVTFRTSRLDTFNEWLLVVTLFLGLLVLLKWGLL